MADKDGLIDLDAALGHDASDSEEDQLEPGVPHRTVYEFDDVRIPDDFLTKAPADAQPVTITNIDFAKTTLPEYAGCYAVVLDNVISPSECAEMLRLVEASVPATQRGKTGTQFWKPALVNIGNGFEILEPDYRNSDRIIWDQQEVVDRLWERCAQAPGLRERLNTLTQDGAVLVPGGGVDDAPRKWEFRHLNKRMRFLKYGPGQFFRPHCDGPYQEPGQERIMRTHFTLHLYLNDSKKEAGPEASLVGGATSFLSRTEDRKLDVDPKAGRVLIFQHRRLYHSGDDVVEGIKYTMRTDAIYELVPVQ